MRDNTQLKFLLYVAFIVLGLYFIDRKFDILEWNIEKEDIVEEETEESLNNGITFEKENGPNIVVQIEVADTDEERERGLMYRNSLGDYEGMLFIYEDDVKNGFWMKNTLIPLDLILISSDGKVVDIITEMQPCKEDICKSYTPDALYRYALEVNGGWAEENGVEEGSTVEVSVTSET